MNTNDIRELSFDETDLVSGGTAGAVIGGIIFAYVAEAYLDGASGKGAVLDVLKKAADEKRGKQKQ